MNNTFEHALNELDNDEYLYFLTKVGEQKQQQIFDVLNGLSVEEAKRLINRTLKILDEKSIVSF
jgi:hypothetical protein